MPSKIEQEHSVRLFMRRLKMFHCQAADTLSASMSLIAPPPPQKRPIAALMTHIKEIIAKANALQWMKYTVW